MRIREALVVGAVVCALAGCSSDAREPAPASDSGSTPSDSAAELPTETPHELRVTLRDEVGWVWKVAGDSCVDGSDFGPPSLRASDESGTIPRSSDVPLPERGATLVDGACEATVTVAADQVARYSLGVAFEGKGIATGDEPRLQPTVIDREDESPQDVTVVFAR